MIQNSVEYLRRILGEKSDKQWYQFLPERYQREISLMQEEYPAFKFFTLENGDICWEGDISVSTSLGDIEADYNPLYVRIKCKRDYPLTIPVVIDVKKILTSGRCEHINKEDNSLCYAFRPTTELDFIDRNFVADVIPVIEVFLLKQFCYEQTGNWPGAEEHGEKAFLVYELEHGCYHIDNLCPCGLTGKSYKECHLPAVERRIATIEEELRQFYGVTKIGRNDKCPCGSDKKYKRCCYLTGRFGNMRRHYLQKYKGLTKDHLLELLNKEISSKL